MASPTPVAGPYPRGTRVQVRYESVGYQLWYDCYDDVETLSVATDMATYSNVNANY